MREVSFSGLCIIDNYNALRKKDLYAILKFDTLRFCSEEKMKKEQMEYLDNTYYGIDAPNVQVAPSVQVTPNIQIPQGTPLPRVPGSMPVNSSGIQLGFISNIGARSSQQDSWGTSDINNAHLVNERGVLAVVADGMGGLSNGAEVSGIVVAMFKELFSRLTLERDDAQELLYMVFESHKAAKEYIKSIGGDMSGSTVVAVIINDNKLHFVSVGDSRIYLLRKGKLLILNRDHVYATELDIKAAWGDISIQESIMDAERNSLTNYIGMDEIKEIDYNRIPISLTAGDKLLLMSDGVFGTLSEDEIVAAVDGCSPSAGASNLEAAVLAHNKPGQDNFTAVIVGV